MIARRLRGIGAAGTATSSSPWRRWRRVGRHVLAGLVLLWAMALAQEEIPHRPQLRDDLVPGHVVDGEGEGEDVHALGEGRNDATVSVVTITLLVIISILFEVFTEFLRESADEMNMPFINTIFSELTTLGFIGLVLFIVTKLDVLSALSRRFLGEEEKLQETIELLHMGLFLFIIIFLVLCVGLLRLGTLVQAEWREFERSSADLPAVVTEYVLATEPPATWRERWSLPTLLATRKSKREMVYLALRRRFVDHRSNHPDPDMALRLAKEFQRNPDIRFPFNEYLSIISGEVMGRLIEIDLPTWVALEVFLVAVLLLCWAVGDDGEVWVLLLCGLGLVLLNEYVYGLIRHMRRQLTPPRLFKDAERLRHKNEFRAKHLLPLHQVNEKSWILDGHETTDEDDVPAYLDTLPHGGKHLTEQELAAAQRALLGGRGNGVKLALFSARLVFLLTAMHLSVFLMRTVHQIYRRFDNGLVVLGLIVLFLLPSIVVTGMSVMIARDGLYAFNVEHMKASRIIAKVMRILKARQTLRTLRFVAEMKIYLRENVRRRPSSASGALPITAALHEATAAYAHTATKSKSAKGATKFGLKKGSSPSKAAAASTATASSSPPPPAPAQRRPSANAATLEHARRVSSAVAPRSGLPPIDTSASSPTSPTSSPPLSPLAGYNSPRERRSDAYRLEMERREIHTIFCLFDIDGSGAVSREEMANLLLAITHELDETQLTGLMADLVGGRPDQTEITFEAFYNWCHQHIQESHHSKEELIEEIFRMVDADNSGYITVDEFIAIFKTLGQSLDHDDVRELVYQMDRNDDGKIDLEEFTKMLQKHEV